MELEWELLMEMEKALEILWVALFRSGAEEGLLFLCLPALVVLLVEFAVTHRIQTTAAPKNIQTKAVKKIERASS